ncbi:MAG: response regulator transcription factor [Oscillospiraceae bacterium]|nr:response regulator transcription factor [Oscillospiraceae bacterium]
MLLESDRASMEANKGHLKREGYDVYTAASLKEGGMILENRRIDLIVMGLILPDGPGIRFCSEIRARYDIPVLFLTHLDDDTALIAGLEAGGDEYMTKPYSHAALSARVRALLRRVRMEKSSMTVFAAGPLQIDCSKRKAYAGGGALPLAPREFDVLLLLAREPGREFTAQEIYSMIWGSGQFNGRTVIAHISSLRKKLRKIGENAPFIVTGQRKYYSMVMR